MIMSAYDYTIVYNEGKRHQNADVLSRLPMPSTDGSKWPNEDLAELSDLQPGRVNVSFDSRPVDASEVKQKTDKDPILQKVKHNVMQGWPSSRNLDDEVRPFAQKKTELTIEDDVLLWGQRVVIPQDPDMRTRIVDELHATHPGIVKMKALARSFVWWSGIDRCLEQKVRTCSVCQEHQNNPQAAPIHPWEFPEGPWIRIHIDYTSIENQYVLIVVDAHIKRIEAVRVPNATHSATVTAMRRLFATHGIPETLVSDNGTQFILEEFAKFLTDYNIKHVQTFPHHPSSNGLAERAV